MSSDECDFDDEDLGLGLDSDFAAFGLGLGLDAESGEGFFSDVEADALGFAFLVAAMNVSPGLDRQKRRKHDGRRRFAEWSPHRRATHVPSSATANGCGSESQAARRSSGESRAAARTHELSAASRPSA